MHKLFLIFILSLFPLYAAAQSAADTVARVRQEISPTKKPYSTVIADSYWFSRSIENSLASLSYYNDSLLAKAAGNLVRFKERVSAENADSLTNIILPSKTDKAAFLKDCEAKEKVYIENIENPFELEELKRARVIFLGERHSHRYPSERMAFFIAEYNKKAPAGEKITHFFMETTSFSLAHVPLEEGLKSGLFKGPDVIKNCLLFLLKTEEAVTQGRTNFNKTAVDIIIHMNYLMLSLKLADPEIVVFGIDADYGTVEQRDALMAEYLRAASQTENSKVVVLGGAAHALQVNVNAPAYSFYNAEKYSAASLSKKFYGEGEVVSVYIEGGKSSSKTQYPVSSYADYVVQNAGERKNTDFILKLNPETDGYHYLFHFDQSKEAFNLDQYRKK